MAMLSSEITSLLDKLYNLRGNDSVVLVSMEKERSSTATQFENSFLRCLTVSFILPPPFERE